MKFAWMARLSRWLVAPIALVCSFTIAAQAQQSTAWPADDVVAATVSGKSITVGDVRRVVKNTFGESQITPENLSATQAEALEQLVNRRLASLALDRMKFVVAEADVDAAVKTLETQAAGRAVGLDQMLAERGMTKATMREDLAWEVRWNKYVRQQITDKELEAWFTTHRRDFDGTELRVSHILFRANGPLNEAAYATLTKQAEQLRSEIVGGKTSFADAARQHSAGPSRAQGGDLGFIPRHDRMVEAFSRAAFALAKGDISPPVATQFGVHLIHCTEIKPGKKSWQDVREPLYTAVMQDLFLKRANEMRPATSIEFTGVLPRLDPKTRQVLTSK